MSTTTTSGLAPSARPRASTMPTGTPPARSSAAMLRLNSSSWLTIDAASCAMVTWFRPLNPLSVDREFASAAWCRRTRRLLRRALGRRGLGLVDFRLVRLPAPPGGGPRRRREPCRASGPPRPCGARLPRSCAPLRLRAPRAPWRACRRRGDPLRPSAARSCLPRPALVVGGLLACRLLRRLLGFGRADARAPSPVPWSDRDSSAQGAGFAAAGAGAAAGADVAFAAGVDVAFAGGAAAGAGTGAGAWAVVDPLEAGAATGVTVAGVGIGRVTGFASACTGRGIGATLAAGADAGCVGLLFAAAPFGAGLRRREPRRADIRLGVRVGLVRRARDRGRRAPAGLRTRPSVRA